ncbi:MAG: hypothetical protein V4590_15000 [Bacteroidota bacterium]
MRVVITTILLAITFQATSQRFIYDSYDSLYRAYNVGDWPTVTRILHTKLNSPKPADSARRSLEYFYIKAIAGLLRDKKISDDSALKSVAFLKGKEIVMNGFYYRTACNAHCTYIMEKEPNTFFAVESNQKGSKEFCHLYVQMKDPVEEYAPDKLEGKFIAFRGKLVEITVEDKQPPRFKLVFKDARYC